MGFWDSQSGTPINGSPDNAFLKDFSTVPDGTITDAAIKSFRLVDVVNQYTANVDKFYEVVWKLVNGEFKNREVKQKIKCFDGKPESIDRNLNMLKLIMNLCQFTPGDNAPTDAELGRMVGKVAMIKISEWVMPKKDGSGFISGNHVSEIHAAGSMKAETGVTKKMPVSSAPDSALQRNAGMPELPDDGIPF